MSSFFHRSSRLLRSLTSPSIMTSCVLPCLLLIWPDLVHFKHVSKIRSEKKGVNKNSKVKEPTKEKQAPNQDKISNVSHGKLCVVLCGVVWPPALSAGWSAGRCASREASRAAATSWWTAATPSGRRDSCRCSTEPCSTKVPWHPRVGRTRLLLNTFADKSVSRVVHSYRVRFFVHLIFNSWELICWLFHFSLWRLINTRELETSKVKKQPVKLENTMQETHFRQTFFQAQTWKNWYCG